jgi:hypothetical protein
MKQAEAAARQAAFCGGGGPEYRSVEAQLDEAPFNLAQCKVKRGSAAPGAPTFGPPNFCNRPECANRRRQGTALSGHQHLRHVRRLGQHRQHG